MEENKDFILASVIGGVLSFFLFFLIAFFIHILYPDYSMKCALLNATQFTVIFTVFSLSVCIYKLKKIDQQ
jgi:membrane protein DedA with SNARE-associated domain